MKINTPDALDRLRKKAADNLVPLTVHIDLTFRCNEKCVHCYIPKVDVSSELTTRRWMNVLDELAELGTLFMTFSGGEIFLREDIFDILDYSMKKRFSTSIYTNGILLDEIKIARLLKTRPRQVGISIYSMDTAVHDAITGVGGSLKRSMNAMKLLNVAGINVVIKTILMKSNWRGVGEIQKWVSSMGRGAVHQYDMIVSPRHEGFRNEDELNLGHGEKIEFLCMRNSNMEEKERSEGMELKSVKRRLNVAPCSAGRNGAYIGPSGDVQPCIEWLIKCGNVRGSSFKDSWMSAGMDEARAFRIRDLNGCSRCADLQNCQICPGLNKLDTGSALIPSMLSCNRTRAVSEYFKIKIGKQKNG